MSTLGVVFYIENKQIIIPMEVVRVMNVIRTTLSVTDFTVDFIVAGTAKRHQV